MNHNPNNSISKTRLISIISKEDCFKNRDENGLIIGFVNKMMNWWIGLLVLIKRAAINLRTKTMLTKSMKVLKRKKNKFSIFVDC